MLLDLWNSYLYEPLLNALIWIYNGWAEGNMGWSVVYLTVLLRLALLPLTLLSFRNDARNVDLNEEIDKLAGEFKYDPVLQKEEVRRRLKAKKIRPWAKALSLGIQGLVLLLLYQVFVGGITGERLVKVLYSFVDFPGTINRMFYGFDLLASHTYFWPGIVGIWLFLEVYRGLKKQKRTFKRGDLFYLVLFPLGVFLFLWAIPMVKSIFVLSSMIFSFIVRITIQPFFRNKKK